MATFELYGVTTPINLVALSNILPDNADRYRDSLTVIKNILAKDPSLVTQQDVTDLQQAADALRNLAQNNQFTEVMAKSVDLVLRSLKASGAIDNNFADTNNILKWQDLQTYGTISLDLVDDAIQAVGGIGGRSFQALVELEYIRTANEIIFDQMNGLKTALSTTKQILETLNDVQDLHNKINPPDPKDIDPRFKTSNASGQTGLSLEDGANAVRGEFDRIQTPLLPDTWGAGINQDDVDRMIALKAQLNAQIASLQQINPLIPGTVEFDQSLQGRLQKVVDDMPSDAALLDTVNNDNPNGDPFPNNSVRAVAAWIFDNQDGVSEDSGRFQLNITRAITAAENLNDEQKEDFRRFLFLFEEYYKSATSILTRLSQIIEKMAQGVRG